MKKLKSKSKPKAKLFKAWLKNVKIVSSMYPFRDGGEVRVLSESSPLLKVSQYFLDKEACFILKSKAPEAVVKNSDGKAVIDLDLLRGILITACNVRVKDISDLDWPTILSLLQQRIITPNQDDTLTDIVNEKPVKISVAMKKVVVGHSAIKQAVNAGGITDYRQGKKSPHSVLESEVIEYFSKHGKNS